MKEKDKYDLEIERLEELYEERGDNNNVLEESWGDSDRQRHPMCYVLFLLPWVISFKFSTFPEPTHLNSEHVREKEDSFTRFWHLLAYFCPFHF